MRTPFRSKLTHYVLREVAGGGDWADGILRRVPAFIGEPLSGKFCVKVLKLFNSA
jgi:hypothetical protein